MSSDPKKALPDLMEQCVPATPPAVRPPCAVCGGELPAHRHFYCPGECAEIHAAMRGLEFMVEKL